MPILPMVSATKTLDKVLCLAADIKHSSFENGAYYICNDTVEHTRTEKNKNLLLSRRSQSDKGELKLWKTSFLLV